MTLMSSFMCLNEDKPLPPTGPMESDLSIFSNNRVALTPPARVPHTMVAQGHYLHIVKGCAERAFENEKL